MYLTLPDKSGYIALDTVYRVGGVFIPPSYSVSKGGYIPVHNIQTPAEICYCQRVMIYFGGGVIYFWGG